LKNKIHRLSTQFLCNLSDKFMSSELDKTYGQILQDLKEKIRQARVRASVVVNVQLLQIYWEIGQAILEQQKKLGWGIKDY
jgi:hypothetical protein